MELPDAEAIINSKAMSIELKLLMLFGGQDTPQNSMDDSRHLHPEFFCHKYGWTEVSLSETLTRIGFKDIVVHDIGSNMWIFAEKGQDEQSV